MEFIIDQIPLIFVLAFLSIVFIQSAMDKIFNNITNGSPYEEKILFVKGREIRVERQALGCARFDFEELCVKPLGAEDYLAISKEFDIIFIEKIPILPSEKRNEAKNRYQQRA